MIYLCNSPCYVIHSYLQVIFTIFEIVITGSDRTTMARRALLLSVVCMVLTWGVIYNAFRQKGEFYPSVVYLTKSRPSMAVRQGFL